MWAHINLKKSVDVLYQTCCRRFSLQLLSQLFSVSFLNSQYLQYPFCRTAVTRRVSVTAKGSVSASTYISFSSESGQVLAQRMPFVTPIQIDLIGLMQGVISPASHGRAWQLTSFDLCTFSFHFHQDLQLSSNCESSRKQGHVNIVTSVPSGGGTLPRMRWGLDTNLLCKVCRVARSPDLDILPPFYGSLVSWKVYILIRCIYSSVLLSYLPNLPSPSLRLLWKLAFVWLLNHVHRSFFLLDLRSSVSTTFQRPSSQPAN